ncbi:hypothetical protein [Rhizobacter sp. P5_C2]
MTISTTTSPRPAVQTENTHNATAPQVSVVPVNTKIAEQRSGAGKHCERLVPFNDGKWHVVPSQRWYTNDRSEALKLASGLVAQTINGFRGIDKSQLNEPALKLAIEGTYRWLSEQMHAIKYKPNDGRRESEFDGGFSDFERGSTAAMEQGNVLEYEKALQRLCDYLAFQNSDGNHVAADTDIDGLLYDIANLNSCEGARLVPQEAGQADRTSTEVFYEPNDAVGEGAVLIEIEKPVQIPACGLASSEKNNSTGIYVSPKGEPSDDVWEVIDDLIADLESGKRAPHSMHEIEANLLEPDVRPNIGRKNLPLSDGDGKKKNDEKPPRRRDRDAHKSGAAKSPATAEGEIKPSGLPGSKALMREPVKTGDLQELLAYHALREVGITKMKVKATRSSYNLLLAQRAEIKFSTDSKTELVKHAASSLKTLQEKATESLFPDIWLGYLATMDEVFDCWIDLTREKKDKSDLSEIKKAFIERSLPLLVENKISEFSNLFRRELMMMMHDFNYHGSVVKMLCRKRGLFSADNVVNKDFAKEIEMIASEIDKGVNLRGSSILGAISLKVVGDGRQDIIRIYDRIYSNSVGELMEKIGGFRMKFIADAEKFLSENDLIGFSQLCQRHASAVNKVI